MELSTASAGEMVPFADMNSERAPWTELWVRIMHSTKGWVISDEKILVVRVCDDLDEARVSVHSVQDLTDEFALVAVLGTLQGGKGVRLWVSQMSCEMKRTTIGFTNLAWMGCEGCLRVAPGASAGNHRRKD